MKLNDLKPPAGAKKTRTRVGRGIAAGKGKTAGRGHKGQKSRAGYSRGAGWEGGKSALIARLPKRGFTRQGVVYQLVNLSALNVFEAGSQVDADVLRARGVVRHADRPIKLLGDGELEVRELRIRVDACSRSAARAVEAAGGSVEAKVAEASAERAAPTAADHEGSDEERA